MVWQRIELNSDYRTIPSNLVVVFSTVCRIVKQFDESGSVCKHLHPKDCCIRKLIKLVEQVIWNVVLRKHGIFAGNRTRVGSCLLHHVEVKESSVCMQFSEEK